MSSISSSQLNKFKKTLLQTRTELLEREKAIRVDIGRKLSADSGERAVDTENADVLDELLREAGEQLDKVVIALARLDASVYQYCRSCDCEIGTKRLQANPLTTLCIECAELEEVGQTGKTITTKHRKSVNR